MVVALASYSAGSRHLATMSLHSPRYPAELRERYEAALAAFVASPIDGSDTIASRRLGEAIAAIRDLPGLSRFRTGPQWDEIASAIEPGWPLVYVNPTPLGTLMLLLCERNGAVSAEAEFIEVTSTEIFMHLFVGGGDVDAATAAPGGSYLLGASVQGLPDHDFAGDLDQLLPWLGETIANPLADLLQGASATGATLVLCGPLGSAPLHAAPLGSSAEILADKLVLRYAPSAAVCAQAGEPPSPRMSRPRRVVRRPRSRDPPSLGAASGDQAHGPRGTKRTSRGRLGLPECPVDDRGAAARGALDRNGDARGRQRMRDREPLARR
jgi:hypothetical protein